VVSALACRGPSDLCGLFQHGVQDAIMDKGYDSNHIRDKLRERNINPVIPLKSNRKEPIDYDKDKYRLREKVERFFNRLKQFRRIATRYDKLGHIFLEIDTDT
jgi:transposase